MERESDSSSGLRPGDVVSAGHRGCSSPRQVQSFPQVTSSCWEPPGLCVPGGLLFLLLGVPLERDFRAWERERPGVLVQG